MPSVIEACRSEQWFGLPLWERQEEILCSLESDDIKIGVLALGRRSGKSQLLAVLALHNLLCRPDLDAKVQAGETRRAVIIATKGEQAAIILERAKILLEKSPLLAGRIVSVTDSAITMRTRTGHPVELTAIPCSSSSARGYASSFVGFDECAHHVSGTEGPFTGERLWAALSPQVSQFGAGGKIVLASSPWGGANFFAKMYRQVAEEGLPNSVAFRLPTRLVNPHITEADLRLWQRVDPVSFPSEYEAEFSMGGDSLFGPIEYSDRGEIPPDMMGGCVAGVDLGFLRDPSALAIVGRRKGDPPGRLTAAVVRQWAPTSAVSVAERDGHRDRVIDQIVDLCGVYRARATFDTHEGYRLRERLGGAGTMVSFGADYQTRAFNDLAARIMDRSLDLYDAPGDGGYPPLSREMEMVRVKLGDAQRSPIVLPRVDGHHCDRPVSLALAVTTAKFGLHGGGDRKARIGGAPLLTAGMTPGSF